MVSDPGCRFVRTEQNLLRRGLVLSSLYVLGVSSVLFHCCVELTALYPFGAIYPPGDNYDNYPLQDKCRERALLNIHARNPDPSGYLQDVRPAFDEPLRGVSFRERSVRGDCQLNIPEALII